MVITMLAGALSLAACGDSTGAHRGREIGLYTSLPIVWGESGDIRELLATDRPAHWAVAVLSSAGHLTPLDTLDGPGGRLPLPSGALLVLAQPRPLSPQENVVLDGWVREGGRVLLFADPLLTMPSRYALGDPRRPQDTAILSPILARWGLRLEFDEAQPLGERHIPLAEGPYPVNLAGRFRVLGGIGPGFSGTGGIAGDPRAKPGKLGIDGNTGDAPGVCQLEAEGLLAHCRVGKGRILAVSDAAIFEDAEDPEALALRQRSLRALLARAESGD